MHLEFEACNRYCIGKLCTRCILAEKKQNAFILNITLIKISKALHISELRIHRNQSAIITYNAKYYLREEIYLYALMFAYLTFSCVLYLFRFIFLRGESFSCFLHIQLHTIQKSDKNFQQSLKTKLTLPVKLINI